MENKLPKSFIGKSGRFYVLRNEGLNTPGIEPKYAMRSCKEAYNNRSGHPEYISAKEAMDDFDKEIDICPKQLKTLN